MKDLHARRPANATAARVIGPGTHYVADRNTAEPVHDAPPLMRMLPSSLPSSFVDLTGRKIGHLTVMGLSARRGCDTAPAARWVCRCVCGHYVERRAKALKNPAYVAIAWCDQCEHTRRLRAYGTGYFEDGTPVRE